MSRKYDEIMERIEISDEMRERTLKNIQSLNLAENRAPKVVRFSQWKRLSTLAACLAIILAGALVLPQISQQEPNNPPVYLSPVSDIAEVDTLDELIEKVGFDISEWSTLPFRAEETLYTAYWQDLAEITYNGEGQTATYRKGIGTEDVSGDFNDYESEVKISIGDDVFTLKGNGGLYSLALWGDGEYSYSLSLSKGVSEAEWQSMITECQ